MQRSRRSVVSQLRASDVTKGGQPLRVSSQALSRSTSRGLPQEQMAAVAELEVGRAGQCRARRDQVDRIEQRAAIVALVAARGLVAAMRAGAEHVAVGQEAPVGADQTCGTLRSSIRPAASSRR